MRPSLAPSLSMTEEATIVNWVQQTKFNVLRAFLLLAAFRVGFPYARSTPILGGTQRKTSGGKGGFMEEHEVISAMSAPHLCFVLCILRRVGFADPFLHPPACCEWSLGEILDPTKFHVL